MPHDSHVYNIDVDCHEVNPSLSVGNPLQLSVFGGLGHEYSNCFQLRQTGAEVARILVGVILRQGCIDVAPWCGHCKHSAPEFTKAAEILQGVVQLGVVNMDQHGTVGRRYQVSGYPTLKFFGRDKAKPITFEGSERTFDKFVEYCIKQMKGEINNPQIQQFQEEHIQQL